MGDERRHERGTPNAAILSVVLKAVPYSHLISDIDTWRQPDVLRFKWRGTVYRVSHTYHVEEVQGDLLVGSDLAILMERRLQLTRFALETDLMVLPA